MLINALLRPQENDEDLLAPEVPYLSVIRALMYLSSYTWCDIAFAVNCFKQDIILQLQEKNGLE